MSLDFTLQDFRVAVRQLAKDRGFFALAVAVIAIGIAAVVTEFAITNGILLKGFGVPRSEQLVDVRLYDPATIYPQQWDYITRVSDFIDLRDRQTSFAGFTAYLSRDTISVTWRHEAHWIDAAYVSHDFFHVLGVAPVLGRDFLPEDDRPGAARAVILSDQLWRSEFGRDPGVIGTKVRANGSEGTVVGVMPPGFKFPENELLWIPLGAEFPPQARNDPNAHQVRILARLKEGTSLAQADQEIAGLVRQLVAEHPEDKMTVAGAVRPLSHALVMAQYSHQALAMLAFSVGVLLIASVNIMNLQFARATARFKELAIRSALGASRGRQVRLLLTESAVIAAVGLVLGVGLSVVATSKLDALLHATRYPLPGWVHFTIDGRVLLVAIAVMVVAALLAGLAPALAASRPDLVTLLKESGRGSTSGLVRTVTRGLVIFQVAAGCVVLIGSLIVAQSLRRAMDVDYGYDRGVLLAGNFDLLKTDYPTNESRLLLQQNLLREFRSMPELAAVALTNRDQMSFAGWGERVEVEGRAYTSDSDRGIAQIEHVSDGYWAVTGQRILAGRDFLPGDNDVLQPAAIINPTFARKFFGAENPVGRRFRLVRNDGQLTDAWRTVVGVVSEVRMLVPSNVFSDNAGFYLPFTAGIFNTKGEPVVRGRSHATIVVRLQPGVRPESFTEPMRRVVARVDPNMPVYYIATPKANLLSAFATDRIIAKLFTALSGIALLLAAVGIYGMMALSISRRIQEFGIRAALGADRTKLILMVLKESTVQLAIGLAIGLTTAVTVSLIADDWIASVRLFHISPRDPATYAVVAATYTLVALLATVVPARRAAGVDPATALRGE